MTPDDVQRVAQAYIRSDRLSIVLVGNARAFVPQLRAVGFTDFEVIPIEQLDLMSGGLRRDGRASVRDRLARLRPAMRIRLHLASAVPNCPHFGRA